MKPLLVGLNNPYGGDDRYALYPDPPGCTGHRLLRALRAYDSTFTKHRYLDLFDRTNLWQSDTLPSGPGKTGKLIAAGREILARVVAEQRRDVVFFGAWAWAAAFKRRAPAPSVDRPAALNWVVVERGGHVFTAHWAPHPSGRNHFYNVGDNVWELGQLLHTLATEGLPQ